MKEIGYYSQERNDVLDLMEVTRNSKIFDVGCGTGGLGRSLKKMGCCDVFGLEVLPEIAEQAKDSYRMVFAENIEHFRFPFQTEYFDYIVCADVLEHLNYPREVMKKLHLYLKKGGFLIASIPNIKNRLTVGDLLRGNFDYRDWGIMDNTHMRFFTFNSMVKMFKETGYVISAIKPLVDSGAEEHIERWDRNGIRRKISEMVKMLINVDYYPSDDALREFFTIQFIFKAQKV